MNNFLSKLIFDLSAIQTNASMTLYLISGLWVIHIVNWLLGYRLNILGIYPRHMLGLIGLPFSSFLHGSFTHIFFNTIPLIVLIDFLLLEGLQKFIFITIIIILVSGIGVWLFGRRAIHLGASNLVMGYWGYLLFNAYQNPSMMTFIIIFVCLYYFGSLVFSLFPAEERISWESHIFGFLGGVACVFIPYTPLANWIAYHVR